MDRGSGADRTRLPSEQGRRAEELAVAYFLDRGWTVRARNVTAKVGEVDIVLEKGPLLVFAEVRYRRSVTWGAPVDTVDAGKRRRVVLAALTYVARCGLSDRIIRFDVVSIRPGREGADIVVIEDAFDLNDARLASPTWV